MFVYRPDMSIDSQGTASSTNQYAVEESHMVDAWNDMINFVDIVDEDDADFSYLALRAIDEEEAYFSNSYQLTTSKVSRKSRLGKGRVKSSNSDRRRNGARVSQSIPTNDVAGCNNNSQKCSKTFLGKKKSKKSLKQLKLRRRQIVRKETQLDHLKARKENIQARVCNSIEQNYHDRTDSGSYEHYESYLGKVGDILPAQDLGLDDGSMYERLLNIFEGDEIMPEDYEILLQLDSNNAKSTLPNDSLREIPILVVGSGDGHTISRSDMKEENFSHCEICLETLMELEDGKELRVLPCEHIFCRGCIDHWFQEVSNRCPNLSCYWCQVDQSEK